MTRLLRLFVAVASLLVLVGAAFSAGGLARSSAALPTTQECNKVKACVHVAGPWVAVPATGEATWLLQCAQRQGSVGGTDARASSVHVHVWFDGQIGAPIQQGITTGSFLLFHAVTDNGKPGAFEPFLGCIPVKKQSTSRSTLAVRRAAAGPATGTPVGVPLDPRATLVVLQAGSRQTASEACPAKETLVGTWNSIGFVTKTPPDIAPVLSAVRVKTAFEGSSVKAAIQTDNSLPLTDLAEAQIGAVCAA